MLEKNVSQDLVEKMKVKFIKFSNGIKRASKSLSLKKFQ